MRSFLPIAAFVAGCGGNSIDGLPSGIDFKGTTAALKGDTIAIVDVDLDCAAYEAAGMVPETEGAKDAGLILAAQTLTWETGLGEEALFFVNGVNYVGDRGSITIDKLVSNESATGEFEITFDGIGTITGSFDATWCCWVPGSVCSR